MITYLVRRIFQSVVFIFAASCMIYTLLVMLVPNSPIQQYARVKQLGYITRADVPDDPSYSVEALNEQYKLDKPWPLNYIVWLFDPSETTFTSYNSQNIKVTLPKGIDIEIGNLSIRGSGMLTGDFGQEPNEFISNIIADRWPNSLFLFLMALIATLVVGIPLGIIGAVRKGSMLDHALTVFSLGGISIPPYALSYFLIIFLALGFKVFTTAPVGSGSPGYQRVALARAAYGSEHIMQFSQPQHWLSPR